MSGRLDSLAWWSGEFRDPAVESAFRASRERAELRQLRLVWLVALGFFGVYGLLEQWGARPEPEAGPWRAVILATGILLLLALGSRRLLALRDHLACLALLLIALCYGVMLQQRSGPGKTYRRPTPGAG